MKRIKLYWAIMFRKLAKENTPEQAVNLFNEFARREEKSINKRFKEQKLYKVDEE